MAMTPEAQQGANPYDNQLNTGQPVGSRRFMNLQDQQDNKNYTPNKTQSDITGTIIDDRDMNGASSSLALNRAIDKVI